MISPKQREETCMLFSDANVHSFKLKAGRCIEKDSPSLYLDAIY